jgi:hypothetical protein
MIKRMSGSQIAAVLSIAAVVVTVSILALLAYGLRFVFNHYGLAAGFTACGLVFVTAMVWALWLDKRHPMPPQK